MTVVRPGQVGREVFDLRAAGLQLLRQLGEFVGGNEGLGYLLILGEGQGRTAMVFVSIILLTVVGILVYIAVLGLERRVLHYMPERLAANA